MRLSDLLLNQQEEERETCFILEESVIEDISDTKKKLDISCNQIDFSNFPDISFYNNLVEIDARQTNISNLRGKIPISVKSINLNHCNNLTEDDLSYLLNDLPNLKEVSLQYCQFEFFPEINNPNLDKLNIAYCNNLNDEAYNHLEKFQNLFSCNLVMTKCQKVQLESSNEIDVSTVFRTTN